MGLARVIISLFHNWGEDRGQFTKRIDVLDAQLPLESAHKDKHGFTYGGWGDYIAFLPKSHRFDLALIDAVWRDPSAIE